jgi:IclR family transcriptional regulator, acetate operon repressor
VATIAVIDRSVAVLQAFASGPGSVQSLAELSRRTNLPKPTVHRLLASLEANGLVERVDGGHQLGMRLFELGEHVPRRTRLREASLPFLQDLFEVSHETVHLGLLDGAEVVYVERIRGHRQNRVASRVGGRQPAYCTGVGKALLAFNPATAEEVLTRPLPMRTRHTFTDPRLLSAELERIRASQLAFDREEHTLGITCVAAPIVVRDVAVAAVSITATSSDVERFAPAVKTAALGIRRALGG